MRLVRSAGGIGLALTATAALALPAHAAPARPRADDSVAFSIADIRAGRISDITARKGVAAQQSKAAEQGLSAAESRAGDIAMVDRSMLSVGITAAASTSFVDLPWDAYASNAQYRISRDGEAIASLPAGVANYRDASVVAGNAYRYTVVPLNAPDADPKARMWSMNVQVPTAPAVDEDAAEALQEQADAQARVVAAASTTTVTWQAFIAQSRIDAPPGVCSYGSGYQFGGDGHGYDWTNPSYRTAVNAVVTWSSKSVEGHVSVGTTHVYRKSDGQLVDQKTASSSGLSARKLGSGSNYVDVRLVTNSSNPFCPTSAIDGSLSMHLTQGGNYSFISGNRLLMPITTSISTMAARRPTSTSAMP
jgi:hypothetical protein